MMTQKFDDELRDTIDEQLDQLLNDAKQHPEGSPEQQRLLRIILNSVALRGRLFDRVIEETERKELRRRERQNFWWMMQRSGAIWMPESANQSISEEDQADLLHETWLWFWKNFASYVPEKASPVTWFNQKLRYKVLDFNRSNPNLSSLDEPIHGGDEESHKITLLESVCSDNPNIGSDLYRSTEYELLRSQIEACLEQSSFTQACASPEHRYIHCGSLLTAFLLDEMEWEEIFEKFGITQDRSLQRRVRRCYRERCLPRLRECFKAK